MNLCLLLGWNDVSAYDLRSLGVPSHWVHTFCCFCVSMNNPKPTPAPLFRFKDIKSILMFIVQGLF